MTKYLLSILFVCVCIVNRHEIVVHYAMRTNARDRLLAR